MSKILDLYGSFNWGIGFLVFLIYIIIDGLYAKYTLDVVAKKPIQSANIGALMHIFLAFGVISYTENVLYIVPLVLGSWLGTYLMVKFDKKK
jgi:hypothetical protein